MFSLEIQIQIQRLKQIQIQIQDSPSSHCSRPVEPIGRAVHRQVGGTLHINWVYFHHLKLIHTLFTFQIIIDLLSQLIIWNNFWYLTSMFDYLSQRRPLFWVWSGQHQQCAGARACWGRWWGCRAGWSSRKIQRGHIGGWLVPALGVISSKTNEQQLLVIIMITIFNHLVVTDLVEHHQTSSRHLENWWFEMFFKMKWVRHWLIIFKILRMVKPGL